MTELALVMKATVVRARELARQVIEAAHALDRHQELTGRRGAWSRSPTRQLTESASVGVS